MQEKFCVKCGKNVILDDAVSTEGHAILHDCRTLADPCAEPEVEFCTGPFLPPMPEFDDFDLDDVSTDYWDYLSDEQPEFFPDWDLQDEPSGDELFIMNRNADELLNDLKDYYMSGKERTDRNNL